MPHLVPGWPSPRSQVLPHLIPVCHHVGLLILIYLRLLRRQGGQGGGGAGCGYRREQRKRAGGRRLGLGACAAAAGSAPLRKGAAGAWRAPAGQPAMGCLGSALPLPPLTRSSSASSMRCMSNSSTRYACSTCRRHGWQGGM